MLASEVTFPFLFFLHHTLSEYLFCPSWQKPRTAVIYLTQIKKGDFILKRDNPKKAIMPVVRIDLKFATS